METIGKNKVVAISYELRVSDADEEQVLVEQVGGDEPMLFLFGESGLPERFEENLRGMQQGDNFEFSIGVEEGYGEYSEEDVIMLPLDVFKIDGEIDEEVLQPGRILPMADQEGNMMRGQVVEVTDEGVLMDFNHPLAGRHMHFKGRVEQVRPATSEEIAHGHVHGHGGHQH